MASNAHPTDPTLTPLRTQPGDVVALVDDGHIFSEAERMNGQYRILDVPGVPQADLVHLVTPTFDVKGTITKRRAQRLDPIVLQNVIWIGRVSVTKAQLDSITVTV